MNWIEIVLGFVAGFAFGNSITNMMRIRDLRDKVNTLRLSTEVDAGNMLSMIKIVKEVNEGIIANLKKLHERVSTIERDHGRKVQ